jgi:hypothetical protein
MLDVKPAQVFEVKWHIRVEKKMDDQIRMLAKKHKTEISTVIRSLIDAGLAVAYNK